MTPRLYVVLTVAALAFGAAMLRITPELLAGDVKAPGVTVKLIGDAKFEPTDGCKMFMSRNGSIRDSLAHVYEDKHLHSLLRDKSFRSKSGALHVLLVITEKDVDFDQVKKAVSRIAKQACPEIKTIISISFTTLNIRIVDEG